VTAHPASDIAAGLAGCWWARGLTLAERLGGTATPASSARVPWPAWAEFVERALADAPSTVDPVPMGSWSAAFAWVLRPFVAAARDRLAVLRATAVGVDTAAIEDSFGELLGRRLAATAARCLVLELNVARVAGRLSGATPQERFADFARQLTDRAALAALFAEYPVLARLLGEACIGAVDAQIEMVDRFVADRPVIVRALLDSIDPGPLVAIETGLGDPHRRGRTVAVLTFADGRRVVYKPRSLSSHVHFGDLVGWLNGRVAGLDLRTVTAVPREGYGWLEFIPHVPCDSARAVERFYHRQGALLALLYAVDAADIHYENLIACVDQPVLVDLETLFHIDLPEPTATGPDPAAAALASSVLRTHLLPRLLMGEHGSLDVSGLGGDRGTVFPTDVAGWAMAGTDQMRLTRGVAEFAGARNRPRFAGRDGDPVDHQEALIAGFRAGYDAIVGGSAEFADLLDRCRDDEIRVVARPTRLYGRLLVESTHPDVLRDALDRDRVLDTLRAASVDDPVRQRLVRYELGDLWAGDIPFFVGRAGSRHVWTTTGERISDMLEIAGLTSAVRKVAMMGEVDRRDQEWLITAALATRRHWTGHRQPDPVPGPLTATAAQPTRLLAAACGIADQIAVRAMHGDDRVNWLGVELLDGTGWAVRQMGAGLAEGYCGVALFLAQTWALTGIARYRDLARKAVRPVPRLLDAFAAQPEVLPLVGCGGFQGLGGIAYALARLGTLVGDPDLRHTAAIAVSLAATAAAAPDCPAGFVDGTAGCLAAMLAVAAETGLPAAADAARACADRLADLADAPLAPCFADGTAGIGWALLRFAAAHGSARHERAGRRLLDHTVDGDFGAGWCQGTTGLLIARAAAGADVDCWDTVLTDRPLVQDLSLCHGELGVAEALTVLAARRDDDRAGRVRTAQMRRGGLVLSALTRYGPRGAVPGGVPTPGLLTGLAGIGYGLLRLGFADRVPSVLLLEPTPGIGTA
jgi:type 2 lantibiotic biosynthesis protein LanM